MHKIIKFSVFLVFLLFFVNVEASSWRYTGNVNTIRAGTQNAMLTNGKIMVISGMAFDANHYHIGSLNTYEIFDPATGEWVQSDVPDSSHHSLAMLLPNGNVLYTILDNGNSYIYDPHTDNWTPAAGFGNWYNRTCGTLLKDGKVLAAGYNNSTEAALYDWASDVVIPIPASTNQHSDAAVEVMLSDGRVLFAGGINNGTACDIYDPGSGAWTTTGPMNVSRYRHVGIFLRPPWEKVLVAGGIQVGAETEIWNGTSWAFTGSLNFGERATATMVLLPNGKALIMGGGTDQQPVTIREQCEIYDPTGGTWTLTNNMQHKRAHFSACVLYTGKVLAVSGQYDAIFSGGWQYYLNPQCEIYDPSEGNWTVKPSLIWERGAHTITPLPIIHTNNCSTNVIVAGGENAAGFLKSCELYNYIQDEVKPTGDLNVRRAYHTAVLLPSGEVFAAGGKNSNGEISSCELYNVNTEMWTFTANLNNPRFDHTATLLKDGRVLVTGGENSSGYLSSCEVYSGGSWSNTNSMATERTHHTAVLLLDGRVLVIGGENSGGVLNSCELWDGANWGPTGNLSTARCEHTAILLQSGKVLAIGGKDGAGNAIASCEIYDPATGNWSPETNLNQARYLHNSTLLYSGLVLASGGEAATGYLAACEIYDPATHEWTVTQNLGTERAYHGAILIPDDKPYILSIGGKNTSGWLKSVEEFDVGLGYQADWQSTITNQKSITTISTSMHIEGTLFRDYSEADGGNHCHVVSSDHPIISMVRIGGGNWQSNGGGQIMYMPLSNSWDETHTDIDLPDTASGYYRLWSIVNGIPCKWYQECPPKVEENIECNPNSIGRVTSIRIYPNPSYGVIYVEFPPALDWAGANKGRLPIVLIQIYDCTGRLVSHRLVSHQKSEIIRLDSLKSGIYFYKVNYKDLEAKGKLVIL